MTTAVVNLMKISDRSIIASNRIALFLSSKIGAPLIDHKSLCFEPEVLYIVNGPMLYCNFREELRVMVAKSKKVVWVMNDYAIPPPSFVKAESPVYWSSCDPLPGQDKHVYTNWNQLTFFEKTQPKKIAFRGLSYYGAYREGRSEYFKKYLGSDQSFKVHISSAAESRFKLIAPKARFFLANPLMNYLGSYESSLYIEDKKSHALYSSPANRFYECLSAHTLMFFDRSVSGTFERAGIDVSPWLVDSPEEVAQLLKKADLLRKQQMSALRVTNYRELLSQQVLQGLKQIQKMNT